MDVSPRSNRAAETAGDFVVAQINVCAACRADCRSRRATDLLLPFTFETLDNRAVLPFPKILKFAQDGGAGWRRRRFLTDPQLSGLVLAQTEKNSGRTGDKSSSSPLHTPSA